MIEINKDVDGPSIEDMLPVFKKVLAKKRLLIWGEFTEEEIALMVKELPSRGLMLHLVAPDVESVQSQADMILRFPG